MYCLDTTFLVDVTRARGGAAERAKAFAREHEDLSAPAPAIAEVLVGANYRGEETLRRTLEMVAALEVLPVDLDVTGAAGRLGADMLRRGTPLMGVDLLVAATALHHRRVLVSRDTIFPRVPGLTVETY
ncbi:MAG: type II toxin-antitoxin system VapC family toxin [Euryarchaeota archaeon]|nr:type II toxin-antitoxin system VapC family toxin [Euryarchaeota archaeon]MDE1835657.1 type II toxin-antitoxin system VapC family toxin [Euryarchaeota archaeon]MDE1879005.1 type II toxin-antitoxin system VapC family toxin [Euryarchaeota archaeon]MDE2043721.1 type II toxin-antitoxin system VapC family toxin [Thermoplasmata archaeon]